MRLFVAIPLAASVTEQLQSLRARLERPEDGLRWSVPESWHITLQFLGNTSREANDSQTQYECLVNRLCTIDAPPFQIQIEGVSSFDRVGVFFAGVPLTSELTHLQEEVTNASKPCGFSPEDRPYRPHITLARNKGQSDGIRRLKPRLNETPRFPAFTAHEFLLYESILGPSGSRYEVRQRFPLVQRKSNPVESPHA